MSDANAQTVPYAYIRALEWEGTWPSDVGVWGRTIDRIRYCEGLPRDSRIPCNDSVLPASPTVDKEELRQYRSHLYFTPRTSREVISILRSFDNSSVSCGLHLTNAWANRSGVIPRPSSQDIILPETHAVRVTAYDDLRDVFVFDNWWANWGDQFGRGRLPVEYFETHAFECSASITDTLRPPTLNERFNGFRLRMWYFDSLPHTQHFRFEIVDEQSDPIAWCFAEDSSAGLTIYELFVKPAHRSNGLAKALISKLKMFLVNESKPLLLRIPFSDAKTFNPTFAALHSIARQLNLRYCEPQQRFDCYEARRGGESASPIRNSPLPNRPTGSFVAVLEASRRFTSSTQHSTSVPEPQSTTDQNARREELARRKAQVGLSVEEGREFTRLQSAAFDSLGLQGLHQALLEEVALLKRHLAENKDDSRP